jgi:hypothetical protein
MTLLAKLLSDLKKESERPKPKPTKLQSFLMKQEKNGLETRQKRHAKQMKKLKQTSVEIASAKTRTIPPPKLELSKAQKLLHKKVFGKKKHISPKKTPAKRKSPKSAKSNSPESTKSNSPKSTKSNSPKSMISNSYN